MILITGGLGYLGSHIALDLMSKGHEVVLVDNLSHATLDTLERLEYITKIYIPFIRLDVRNTPALQKVFEQYPIEYVVHAAGFKSLIESQTKPLDYYNNNLSCMMSVLRCMQRSGVRRLVNLSSITVYGTSGLNFTEDSVFDYHHSNPYVRSQQTIEQIITDTFKIDDYWQILNLRISNVVGSYNAINFGEWVPPLPNSVLSILLQKAQEQNNTFEVFQDNLNTQDGFAERNYIHILDVLDAIYKLMLWSNQQDNFLIHFNLASQEVMSIKQLVNTVEKVTQTTIDLKIQPDTTENFIQLSADTHKIKQSIDWKPQHTIHEAVVSQWNYYQKVLNR